jgi:N-acetylneuraminic acid mutarotase
MNASPCTGRQAKRWKAWLVTAAVALPSLAVAANSPAGASHFTTVTWTKKAPAPLARSEAAGAAAGGKLYVFGGYLDTTYVPSARADAYDPVNNTWSRISDLPQGTTHAGTAVDGTNVYLAGGYIPKEGGGQIFATKAVWKYDTVLDQWSSMPPLPQARGGGALAATGGELHFFGGSNSRRADRGEHFVLKLDGSTSWTTSPASLPNPRNHLGAAVVGGKIYAVGGQRGQDAKAVIQDSVHVWNPLAPGAWTEVASLPRGRSHISASVFAMDGHVLVAGGNYGRGMNTADVASYDPGSASWMAVTPLPAPRVSGVGAALGNVIFFTTGSFRTTTYKGVPGT